MIYIDDTMNLMLETMFMIWIRPKQYPLITNRQLHPCVARPFKALQWVGSNVYVIDLPFGFRISSTFNIEDLVTY
jgi:hypothetical protein